MGVPVPSPPRYWRERRVKYRLLGSVCKSCGRAYYPPRLVCPECGSTELAEVKLPERGRVLSFTVIRTPPRDFLGQEPYVVALIELENGARLLGQVVDVEPEEVEVGMEVESVFRKCREQGEEGIIEYGIKWRPPLLPKSDA